jgi:hypothetical protein
MWEQTEKRLLFLQQLLFQPLNEIKLDEIFYVQIQLVQVLAGLYKHQETLHQFRKLTKTTSSAEATDTAMDIDPPPPRLQCMLQRIRTLVIMSFTIS